jgi:Tfp pilus assembly protein PilF
VRWFIRQTAPFKRCAARPGGDPRKTRLEPAAQLKYKGAFEEPTMRYRCAHCDQEIELPDGDKPRCPSCMRVHGLTPIAPVASGGSSRRASRIFVIALVLGCVAFSAAIAWTFRRSQTTGGLPPAALANELTSRGLSADGLERLLLPSDAVMAFASQHAGAARGLPRAQAVVAALRARADKGAWQPSTLADTRSGEAPLNADQTLAALATDGAKKQLYPLELAALAVAALRNLDEPAVLVEVFAFAKQPRPLDPSGRLGYYAVGLRSAAGAIDHVLDVYGGRSERPQAADMRALSDQEALGAALAVRAAQLIGRDPRGALKAADAAVALAPSSPTTRSARAIALLANAGSDEAERELRAAAQLRSDGPRRHNLAVFMMAAGDYEGAEKELRAALELAPELASARVTLASLVLAQGDADGAKRELSEAERIDPTLQALPLVWAQYYRSLGDTAQALVYAQRGVDRQPDDPQPRMLLAQLYREQGNIAGTREQAARVIALVPPEQRDRVRVLLEQMLGPEALGAAPQAAAPTAPAPSGTDLQLKLEGTPRSGPSLLGGAEPPASGTLQGNDAAPRLELPTDSRLKLDP